MSALYIIQDLLEKSNDVFLEHFARLGVISKVSEMVGPLLPEEHDEDEIDGVTISQEKKVWKFLDIILDILVNVGQLFDSLR